MTDYKYLIAHKNMEFIEVTTDSLKCDRKTMFGVLDQVLTEWSHAYFGAASRPISVSLSFIMDLTEMMPLTVAIRLKHQTGSMAFFDGDVVAAGQPIATCSGMIKKSKMR